MISPRPPGQPTKEKRGRGWRLTRLIASLCEKMNSAIAAGWRVLAFTALHFRQDGRLKHNLRDLRTSIMDTLAEMQRVEDNKSKQP